MLFHSQIYNIESVFKTDFKLDEALDKTILSIPFYQRNYVWTSDQATKLLTDILTAFNASSEQYFLGGIVLSTTSISENNEYIDIVDGQQRTITIAIILATLFNFLQHKKEEFCTTSGIKKENIESVYKDNFDILKLLVVTHKSSLKEGTKSYFKIKTSEYLEKPFESFIDYLLLEEKGTYKSIESFEDDTKLGNQESYENIVEVGKSAYSFFSDNLNDIFELEKFVPYLLKQVLLVATITDDRKNAFMIFETLNDRGVGLSPDDLIKSHLIQNVTKDYKKLSNLWDVFIENLRGNKGIFVLKPLDFFDHLFLSEGDKVKHEDIYEYFTETYVKKHNLTTDKNIEVFLNKLISLSKDYSQNQKDHSNLVYLSFGNSTSTLFALHSIRSKKEKVTKFTKQLERIAIVYFLNGHTKVIKDDLCKLNKILFDNLKDIEVQNIDRKINATFKLFVQEVNHLIKKRSINFENSIINMHIPKSGVKYKQVRYMLVTMAKKLGTEYNIDSQETTIEHLMPLKLPNSGCFSHIPAEKYQVYNKRLGNLTIMNKALNQSLGSDCFKDKISAISNHKPDYLTYSLVKDEKFTKDPPYGKYKIAFKYKRKNKDINKWSIEEIENRSECLARLAKFIWVDNDNL